MKIYIDGKAHKIDLLSLPLLGRGKEGIVYNYNGQALKIYSKDRPKGFGYPEITKERIDFLSTLNTSYFILPKNSILNNDGLLIGTISPLLEEKKPTKNILDEPINTAINSIKLVYDEGDIFNKNKVLLNDLNNNFLYNIFFYFFDSDLYSLYNYLKNPTYEIIVSKENIKRLNDFFINNLFLHRLSKESLASKECIINFLTQSYFKDCCTFCELLKKLSTDNNYKTLRETIKKEQIYQKIKTL